MVNDFFLFGKGIHDAVLTDGLRPTAATRSARLDEAKRLTAVIRKFTLSVGAESIAAVRCIANAGRGGVRQLEPRPCQLTHSAPACFGYYVPTHEHKGFA